MNLQNLIAIIALIGIGFCSFAQKKATNDSSWAQINVCGDIRRAKPYDEKRGKLIVLSSTTIQLSRAELKFGFQIKPKMKDCKVISFDIFLFDSIGHKIRMSSKTDNFVFSELDYQNSILIYNRLLLKQIRTACNNGSKKDDQELIIEIK
jgi:hypothetical protein